ncbi:hypothetical protein EJC49_04730 [Aquibium carbonis]|uniref:Carrier domain-containing protein n=1 Tax=Aquibium carbonis TaxID=2495581 RepID=A0A429Z1G1_9HYPH|nr:non-ribosomal peptide synthetase [Aquibium carbonis]RST87533.1 hypothetical protein EJC49_04730 [Aquibium carbonis]
MNPAVLAAPDIASVLKQAAAQYGDAVALLSPDHGETTYRELDRRIAMLAGRLRARGVDRGARLGIVMPNGPDMSVALLAACSACTAVPFNPAFTRDEHRANFTHSGVRLLLADTQACGPAVAAARELGLAVIPSGELLGGDGASTDSAVSPGPDDVAMVLTTSGTTGRGKLVPLTHRNLCAGAADVVRSMDLGAGDRVLSMWEQHHIGGIVDLLLAPLMSGGSVVVAGGFDAARFFDLLPRFRPTWFQGVPATLRELYHHAMNAETPPRGSSLRFLRSVAAALPPQWMADLEASFGVPVIQTFGMTEASPLITSTRLPPAVRKPNSTGSSCGTLVAILDAEGRALPAGQSGHVAIRGANVFAGYENDPQANAEAFRDGWFYTGDLGRLDADGDLFLTGRAKELINRGGEKISPYEIEEALLGHPGIEDAAAFPVVHPTLGEDLGVAVVIRPGAIVTHQDVRSFVGGQLAAFKIPRHFMAVESLPKSPVGKVLRKDVAALFAARQVSGPGPARPTNELEAALAALWADELDVPEVGIDDSFAAIGGDSLSSVRIFLAAEAMVGFKLPDEAVRHFDTVRSMAACLVELGCSVKPPFGQARDATDRDAVLDLVTGTMADRQAITPDFLRSATSEVAFEAARHTAETISTPAELKQLIEHRGGASTLAALLRHPILSLRIARRRASMRREFEATIAAAADPLAWVREEVGPNVDLFHAPHRGASARKTLVVGFSSRAMRLTAPTYHILCALDPAQCELLVLRDPSRRHYLFGIPGVGDTIEAAARWLETYASARGNARVVALGTSAGAIPAICAAIVNRWPRVLAAGADRPSHHPHLTEVLRLCAGLQAREGATTIVLAYSARKQRDAMGAAEIKTLIDSAILKGDERFKDHALLYLLQRKGELGTFLKENLLA